MNKKFRAALRFGMLAILGLSAIGGDVILCKADLAAFSYPLTEPGPSSTDPISISKYVTPVEGGKSVGNMLMVKVEVRKKDNRFSEIKDLDIFESIDDSLHIVPAEDNYGERLINYVKTSDAEVISELADKLSRNIPYSSPEFELHENAILPELEPEVCYGTIIKFSPRLKLNLTNISQDLGNDRKNLLKLLRIDFNLKWANLNQSNFSYMPMNIINDEEIISIKNSDKYSNDLVRIQIDNSSMKKGKAIMSIAGLTSYYLDFDHPRNKEKYIYDWSGVIRLHVDSLSSKDRLIYWYFVKPKKSGVFSTESIVRINDKAYANWPDIIYPIDIEVSEPDLKFEVVPVLESSNVYAKGIWWYSWFPNIFNEMLNLKYYITYTGSAGAPYNDNIIVKRQEHLMGGMYLDRDGTPLLDSEMEKPLAILSFSNNKRQIVNSSIIYEEKGTYQIPGIIIGNALYFFSDIINVDDPLARNAANIISAFIFLMSFLLTAVYRKELIELLRSPLKYKKN